MILGMVTVIALLVGFLAGLTSFKKTNEYCDRHGVTRLCPLCTETHAGHAERTALTSTHFSEV
ncbi:hypothetical protein ACQPZJ_11680 [Actinoplanes sp. CA-054009]